MTSQLEQLKKYTTVVADSGDFNSFKDLKPQDATTNPSLLLAAFQNESYKHILDEAIAYAKKKTDVLEEQVVHVMDQLYVIFGTEILKIIPGRVSTEIDARLSYDIQGTIEKCHHLAKLYTERGVDPKEHVYFKIASTWEGIQAAKVLEKEGFHTNMTLLFSFCQAVAAADAGVTLISPFVGRILDFWKKETGKDYSSQEDPGVLSVSTIFNYYKKFGYKTIVMGASFRNKGEITELCGCDYLTISPKLLTELAECNDPIDVKLDSEKASKMDIEKVTFDETSFRWALNEDPCASVKLPEGIRNFAKDTVKMEALIREKLQQ